MSYVIYLLPSPPLRAPSVLGGIISSCPLKTIETLSPGFFTRPSAPPSGLRVHVAVCAYLPKGCFNDWLQLLILFSEIFLWSCKPLCVCVKGGLNKRILDLTWSTHSSKLDPLTLNSSLHRLLCSNAVAVIIIVVRSRSPYHARIRETKDLIGDFQWKVFDNCLNTIMHFTLTI